MYNFTKKWFVVYTKPRWEKKVADLLGRRGIEHFCPVSRVQKQWSDRKKVLEAPLFTSYVFVHIDEREQMQVRLTDGVVNFVYWLGKPAVIRDEEIETLMEYVNNYHDIRLEKTFVNLQDKVRVIGGPLINQSGEVVSVKNSRIIKVMLPCLGYLMYAELKSTDVELLREEKTTFLKKRKNYYSFRS